jgi:regulator of protease activity HflC (stomatin/prohibitin superfamily)
VVSCITGIVLLCFGFSSLEATEYGLDYSWISKTVNPEVKENGLYFLGIGHSFIKFPKNVQNMEFSRDRTANRPAVESRTSDGLEVILEISFQYQLQPENLYKMFNKYGELYQTVLQNIAIDMLTDRATQYTVYEFFMKRGPIKDDFQDALDKQLSEIVYANVHFLQLRTVDLPALFVESIQESEVKKQDIQKAYAELSKVNVEVDTRIKSAEYQKNVTINRAEGEAQAMIEQNLATVKSLKQVQGSKSTAYSYLKTQLGMTNDALINYIKSKLIRTYDGHNMALSVESPEMKPKA